MTSVDTRPRTRRAAVRDSEFGLPEVVDPRGTAWRLVLVMSCVIAGLGLTLWALTDSLEGSRSIELPRLEVPSVQLLDIGAARALLERSGFAVEIQFQPNEEQPKGAVIGQKPLAGSKSEQGELVVVLASDGPLGQSVPDVSGQISSDAIASLHAEGLAVEVVPTSDESIRPDEVIATEPQAGARITGGAVRLLVSSGPAPRLVPPVLGEPVEKGLAEIGRAGLQIGKLTRVFRQDIPPGTIFGVNPAIATPLPKDTPVDLQVAGPQPTSTVPYLVGLLQATAAKVIREADLQIKIVTSTVTAGDPTEGRVIAQGTPPQAEVAPSSIIEVTVAVAGTTDTTVPAPGG